MQKSQIQSNLECQPIPSPSQMHSTNWYPPLDHTTASDAAIMIHSPLLIIAARYDT